MERGYVKESISVRKRSLRWAACLNSVLVSRERSVARSLSTNIGLVPAPVQTVRGTGNVRNVSHGVTWLQSLEHTNIQQTLSESQSIYEWGGHNNYYAQNWQADNRGFKKKFFWNSCGRGHSSFPPPVDLSDTGIEPAFPASPAFQAEFFFFLPTEPSGKPRRGHLYFPVLKESAIGWMLRHNGKLAF